MIESRGNTDNTASVFNVGRISTDDGWKGVVSLCDSRGSELSVQDWIGTLDNFGDLLGRPERLIKNDGTTKVGIYRMSISGISMPVVIKIHEEKPGIANFFRDKLRDKSLRNFRVAARLCNKGVPTAFPLCALRHKNRGSESYSLFITEYIDNSCDLHEFVSAEITRNSRDTETAELKKVLCLRISDIFAGLEKCRLWHRDAKAGNFLVAGRKGSKDRKNEDIKVMLIDMDGIKRRILPGRKRSMSSLAKLGSTLIWHGGIYSTDYLRIFRKFSVLIGLEGKNFRSVFRRLSRMAVALRVMTMVKSAIKNRAC